ncbi:MAG: S8 family serine peptidase [Bacteroidales bacterium]
MLKMFSAIGGLIVAVLLATLSSSAQSKYFVKFTDKNNSPFSIDNPAEFLSERAINRRNNQNINITETDLPVTPTYIQQLKEAGVTVNYSLKWINGAVVTIENTEQLTDIQNLPFVDGTEKVYDAGAKATAFTVDVRTIKPSKRTDDNTNELNYGASATQVKMLNGHILHNNGMLGDGIQIAIIDAGFYNADTYSVFDSLRARNGILGVKDFVKPNSNIYAEHYHGMMVLSTMAGYVDGSLIGTAPHAKYWLIRTEDVNSEQIIEEYNWEAGAEFADSVGADIINTSLGYTTFDVESQSHTYTDLDGSTAVITKAANIAASKGLLVVVSAGNDGSSDWHYLSAPADSPNVLTAGAVDGNGIHAYFSSFGPSADGRVKPDVCTMGQSTVLAIPDGTIGISNGTSFSAPLLSGMMACLWQARPQLTPSELIQLVQSNASLTESPNDSLGYGIPNFASAVNIPNNYSTTDVFQVIPNPFEDHITILLPGNHSENIKYTVYSIKGEKVLQKKLSLTGNKFEISLPDTLPGGIYLIKVVTSSKTYTGKGIKQ